MRRRPPRLPIAEGMDTPPSTGAGRVPSCPAIGLAPLVAVLLIAAPFGASAQAQVAARDATDPRDGLRRPTTRATPARPGVRPTTASPLRGALGAPSGGEAVAVDPASDATGRDTSAGEGASAASGSLTLEPIGRPATPPRPATATGSAGRIDPATGRPLASGTGASAGRGPVAPGATVKGGPVLPETAVQPRPRDMQADKRAEALVEDDDYTPLGLRAGGFTWLPAVEASAGWSSNVASKAGGTSGGAYRLAPELVGRSDWSRHSLQFELRGAYLGNTTDHDYDRPSYQGALRGRIDLGDETTIDVKTGWSHDRQPASSADNPADTVVPATVDNKSASIGLTRDVGLLALTLRGDIERSDYTGGTTASGASLGSETQNNTRHIAALRATWGSKGSIRPFVEAQISTRDYDDAIVAGSPRDSTGAAVKTGIVADLGPTLRGELSTGWGVERPDKGPLPEVSGWLLDGSLTWSPTRLTTVRLDARTSFDPTTLATSSGAVTRTVGVAVDQALRPNLVASAGVAVVDKRYVGTSLVEDTVVLSSGLTYKVDRNIQTFVKGTLTRFDSSSRGANYDAAAVMVGVRLQR